MSSATEHAGQDPSRAAWFEDDRFWESAFPCLFPEEKFTLAEEQVGQLSRLTGSPFSRVLDLCCGPGRHAIPLAKQGLQVTGVDRSSFLLEKARARAETEKVIVEWIQGDMRTFTHPGHFDLVINLWTSFGYFGSTKEDLVVLRNAYVSLRPGGFFVIDLRGKEIMARKFAPRAVEELADGSILVEKREIIQDWCRIKVQWLLIRNDQITRVEFDHALYSGRELTDLLRAAGFPSVRLYGTWQGAPYDFDAQRLIAVATKPV